MQLWGRVLVSPQGIYIAVLQILKPLSGERSYLYTAHKQVDTRLVRTRKMLTPTHLTTNQSEECPQADHSFLFEPLP